MLPRLFNPAVFQGSLSRQRYFEGWYHKHVSADGSQGLSLIPGVSLAPGDRHAFVQYIEGPGGRSGYVRYPLEDFSWERRRYEVRLGPNHFSRQGCDLDLHDGDTQLSGSLRYSQLVPYPSRLLRPGIMGWYSFVPFMECNHGVVSINHLIDGTIRIDGRTLSFSRGKGYIEKDWGGSFPEAWLWLQGNTFRENEASLMVSVAKIPWLRRSFIGFLAFFYLQDRLYLFTTYNASRLSGFRVDGTEALIRLTGPQGTLSVFVRRRDSSRLKAPAAGAMNRAIRESLGGEAEVQLHGLDGTLIFSGTGHGVGFETEGDIQGEIYDAGYASSPSTG